MVLGALRPRTRFTDRTSTLSRFVLNYSTLLSELHPTRSCSSSDASTIIVNLIPPVGRIMSLAEYLGISGATKHASI